MIPIFILGIKQNQDQIKSTSERAAQSDVHTESSGSYSPLGLAAARMVVLVFSLHTRLMRERGSTIH